MTESYEQERRRIAGSARLYFDHWPGLPAKLQIGVPELVRTTGGEPSYWLVPGLGEGGIEAVARILDDGRLATMARLTAPAPDCAAAVTGLSAAQAAGHGPDVEARYGGKLVAGPTLVHDGPVGREAWLYRLSTESAGEIWVFATAGGTYTKTPIVPSE